jgi:hypothetical protein
MYVGIIRGSGRNDQAGAKEAFQSAIALDPGVKLDSGLATPETQATFAQSSGGGGGAAAPEAAPAAPDNGGGGAAVPGAGAEGNGVTCTPAVTEVETRRPIPVQCRTDEEATSFELRYKPFGAETWKTLRMEHKGDSFRAQIPCSDTQTAGTFKLYVHGKNAQGQDLVNWGTKAAPITLQLVEASTADPPSFDDADPPNRCQAKEECPPDFPGCDSGGGGGHLDWGAQCNNSSECKRGLLCMDGTCETAPSCSTDSDCSVGTCSGGKCSVADGEGGSSGPMKKWWVGINIAQDFAFVGGNNVCMGDADFSCYLTDSSTTPYDTEHFQTTSVGPISTGAVLATTRLLLSVDRVLTPNITIGARLGYAFRGGPPANRQVQWSEDPEARDTDYDSVTNAGASFMPFHFELRAAYWFGRNALARRGLRPYVHVGGGMAQVDAKVIVKTLDRDTCPNSPDDPTACDDPTSTTADAWKKLGRGFAMVGGGVMYPLSGSTGLQLNVNAMYMFSGSGIVLQPSLGMVFGL